MGQTKFVFFGSPEFAAIILEKLIKAGHIPAAVICNPDKPVGRKKIITPPPVKIIAQKYNIPVLQPETLSASTFYFLHSTFSFFVVAAYAKIIPKEILKIPRLGKIGIHPSLLPKHRGASPIQTAILEGDESTGTTLFLIDEKVDHGPILESRKWKIENSDTYEILHDKLAELAGDLLIETLPKFLADEIKPQIQNEAEATYTKKFTTGDAFVDINKDDHAYIERKIRALNPEPGVWTYINGKRTKLLEAEIIDKKLHLKKIQVEGKKPKNV